MFPPLGRRLWHSLFRQETRSDQWHYLELSCLTHLQSIFHVSKAGDSEESWWHRMTVSFERETWSWYSWWVMPIQHHANVCLPPVEMEADTVKGKHSLGHYFAFKWRWWETFLSASSWMSPSHPADDKGILSTAWGSLLMGTCSTALCTRKPISYAREPLHVTRAITFLMASGS